MKELGANQQGEAVGMINNWIMFEIIFVYRLVLFKSGSRLERGNCTFKGSKSTSVFFSLINTLNTPAVYPFHLHLLL